MDETPGYQRGVTVLTTEIVETLRSHRRRTGKGPQALLNGARDKPQGFTATAAANWMKGRAKHAPPDHLEYLLARYEACADAAHPGEAVLRIDKLRALVRKELRRTRTSEEELRRMLAIEEKRSWQFLPRKKLEDALELLRALPTRPKPPRKRTPKPRKRLPWLDSGYFWEKQRPQS